MGRQIAANDAAAFFNVGTMDGNQMPMNTVLNYHSSSESLAEDSRFEVGLAKVILRF